MFSPSSSAGKKAVSLSPSGQIFGTVSSTILDQTEKNYFESMFTPPARNYGGMSMGALATAALSINI